MNSASTDPHVQLGERHLLPDWRKADLAESLANYPAQMRPATDY